MTGKRRIKVLEDARDYKEIVQDQERITLGTTKGGKDVQIVPTGRGTLIIKFYHGGELPECLTGEFSYEGAQRAVELYLKGQ